MRVTAFFLRRYRLEIPPFTIYTLLERSKDIFYALFKPFLKVFNPASHRGKAGLSLAKEKELFG
ncbi:MAG: hypothetical protein JXL82_03525 [Candidatus Omnitrophica bacterium]|nr:hypothetical protein [Candidatus Omnitrophota bacterium]